MAYCPTTMPYGSGWDTQKASERPTWYPASRLHTAWGLLINASRTDCANTTATAFDIADVGREYISIAACNIAYDALRDAHTTAEIIKANATMGMVMADLDRLLAASGGFLLGQWISDARALAINAGHPEDANFLEWNGVCSISLHRLSDLQFLVSFVSQPCTLQRHCGAAPMNQLRATETRPRCTNNPNFGNITCSPSTGVVLGPEHCVQCYRNCWVGRSLGLRKQGTLLPTR